MLPTTSVPNMVSPPASLVNTSIAGNYALRPPSDVIAPPVSGVEIHNNSKGTGGAIAGAGAQSAAGIFSDSFPGVLPFGFSGGGISSSTAFYAQIVSQGEDAPIFLKMYAEMAHLSQVRYKPSNAQLPPPEPAGVYGRMMQQEKLPRDVALPPVADIPQEADTAATLPLPVPRPARERTSSSQPSFFDDVPEVEIKSGTTELPVITPVPRANNAYAATIIRNRGQDSQTVESA